MMPNRSLCWMYSSYLSSVSSLTPRRTPVLPPPRFHLSFLLSHLINLLSFLFFFYLLYYLSQPSIFFLLSFQPSTSLPPRRTDWHTHSLSHSLILQFCSGCIQVIKCQNGKKKKKNGNKSQKQQPTTFPVFSKEPPQRNTPIMSTINHFFLLKIQSFFFFVSVCM